MLVDTAHAGHDPQPSAVAVQPEQTPSDQAGSLPPSYEPQAAADDAPSAGAADPAAAQPGPSIGTGAGQPAPWQAPVYVPDAMYWHQQAAAREFVPLPPDLVRPRRTVEELPELRFIEADPTVFTGVSSEVLERATRTLAFRDAVHVAPALLAQRLAEAAGGVQEAGAGAGACDACGEEGGRNCCLAIPGL